MKTDEFIDKSKKIHGDKYDYSKVEYINSRTKVCIICPEHGEFWQLPGNHLRSRGCKKCSFDELSESKKNDTNFFVKKSKKIHNSKYDYSKTKYIDNKTKVCIICPEHGEFWQNPNSHMQGSGCPVCAKNNNHKKRTNIEDFIAKAKDIHNNKYDYSQVKYNGVVEKVCIICPEHGEFWQKPYSHLSGVGCPKCANNQQITTDEFIKRSIITHGDKYDYSKSNYINNREKLTVICHKKDNNGIEHGEFIVMPHAHMQGSGCPKCKQNYKLENEVRLLLTENNIKFEEKKTFKNLKHKLPLKPDFFIPEYDIVIECQGEQHYKPIDFAGKGKNWAIEHQKLCELRDKIKRKYFKENNIKLIEYTHLDINGDNIVRTKEDLLKNILHNEKRN